jgi:hypothetical protein
MVLKVKKERIYSKSRKSPYPAYIDPNARGTGYIILYAYGIYTAVRHKIPLPGSRVLDLGSRVSMVSGLRPWSLVTWSPWLLDHWVYRVIGLGSLHGIGSLLGHGLGSSQQPRVMGQTQDHRSSIRIKPRVKHHGQAPWSRVEPRVKPLAKGQSQTYRPGSSPSTRVTRVTRVTKHQGHQGHQTPGSPDHPPPSPGPRVKPLAQGRAQGQATSPWSEPSQQTRSKPKRPGSRVMVTGQTISPGLSPNAQGQAQGYRSSPSTRV